MLIYQEFESTNWGSKMMVMAVAIEFLLGHCVLWYSVVIKPFLRYDRMVDGVVTTVSGYNCWSPLDVLKYRWACQWILSQFSWFHYQICLHVWKATKSTLASFSYVPYLGLKVHEVDYHVMRIVGVLRKLQLVSSHVLVSYVVIAKLSISICYVQVEIWY